MMLASIKLVGADCRRWYLFFYCDVAWGSSNERYQRYFSKFVRSLILTVLGALIFTILVILIDFPINKLSGNRYILNEGNSS